MPAFACPLCNQPLVPPPQGGRGRCPRCAGEVTFPLSASAVPGASAGPAPSFDATTLSPAGIGPDTPTRTGAPPAPVAAPAVADDPTESLGLPAIPGYQILGVLGRGGMGAVYKARQKSLSRLVALKMILAGSHAGTEELARFKAEAESLAKLRHPNIVQVFEIDEHEGKPFISLEYVEGGSLAGSLRTAPMAPRPAAEVVHRLALAMAAAHDAGVVHRDLKPANVLLTADGTPKITDFGLAKQLDSDSGQTRSGTVMGTPSYMAPEQASGRIHEIGPAADVYALGAILYETLTGVPPFRGPTPLDTLAQVVADEPVSARRLQRQIPPDLDTICLKCLEKDPRRRYPSARALADDLQRVLDNQPITARPVGATERALKRARRKPAVAALSVGLALTLVVGFALVSFLYVQAEQQRQAAEEGRRQAVEAEEREKDLARDAREGEAREKKLAASEKIAREKAVEALGKAEAESLRAQRLAVTGFLERGRNLCEQGDVGQGLLSFARALELVPKGADDLERTARLSLAVWEPLLPRLRAGLPHHERLSQALFRPDGKVVLTGTQGRGQARRWDADTGEPIAPGLRHDVTALCFSPSGKFFAVGDQARTARVYNAATGETVGPPLTHPGPVSLLEFSPSNKLLLSGSSKELQVWDVAGKKLLFPPIKTEGQFTAATFLLVRQSLATAEEFPGRQTVVRLRALDTGKPTDTKLDVPNAVGRLQYHDKQGLLYIVGSGGGQHRVWYLDTGKVNGWGSSTVPGHAGALSPDGRMILHGTDQYGNYYLHHAWVQGVPGRVLNHNGGGATCVFSSDGRLALTGASDRTARLWDGRTGERVGAPLLHPAAVQGVGFARNGQSMLTRAADQVVRLWDLPDRVALPHRRGRGGHRVAFAADGKELFVTGDGEVRCVDPATLAELHEPIQVQNNPLCLAVAGDGHTLALGYARRGQSSPVELWDLRTRKLRRELVGHRDGVDTVAFSPDSKMLASASRDGTVRLWDVETGKAIGEPLAHPGSVGGVAFLQEGKTVASASGDRAWLWDVRTQKQTRELSHPAAIRSLVAAHDGGTLWTGGDDGVVRRWDAATGTERGPSLSVFGEVGALAPSRDGRLLVTGTATHQVQLWAAETGFPLGPRVGFPSVIADAAFSPDGKRFSITGHYNGHVVFDPVPAPGAGDPRRLSLRLQVLTGMELEPTSRGLALPLATWQQRKASLAAEKAVVRP